MKIRNPEEYKLDTKLSIQNPKTFNKLGAEVKGAEQAAGKGEGSEAALADSINGVMEGMDELQQEMQKAELAGAISKTGITKETDSEEKIQNTQDSASTSETRKDTASLSKESQITGTEKKWTPEEELRAWEEILTWLPISGESVDTQMKKLMDLYMKLLEAILKNTYGDEQLAQLEKLDQVLVFHLDQITENSLPELNDFLTSYGPTESINRLKRSLYHAITGRYLSPDSVKQAWNQISRAGQNYAKREIYHRNSNSLDGGKSEVKTGFGSDGISMFKTSSNTNQNTTSSSTLSFYSTSEPDGKALYGKSGKTTASSLFRSQNQMEPAEKQLNLTQAMQKNMGRKSAQINQNGIYLLRDMERGEKFVSTIVSKNGNLFENSAIMLRNEPMTGLYWAMNKCKTEMFLTKEIPNSPLGKDLIAAEEKMTASYLNQSRATSKNSEQLYKQNFISNSEERIQMQKEGMRSKTQFQKEQVYDVYQYVMHEFHSGQEANKAIRDGFYYALKYFFSEEQAAENKKRSGNQKGTETLAGKREGFLLRQDLQIDMSEMEKNWSKFIASMGYREGALNLKAQLYSPWGQAFHSESEPEEKKTKKGESLTIVLGIALTIIVILFIVFFL